MADLTAAVRAHRQLAEQVRSAFPEADDETLTDSIDSATELDQAIVAVLRAADVREALAEALGKRIKEMAERKKRLENGVEAMRRAVCAAMLDVGWKKLPAPVPDFTPGISYSKHLIVPDEAKVPDEFVEVETVRKLKRREISAHIKAHPDCTWATFSNDEPHLVIRRG